MVFEQLPDAAIEGCRLASHARASRRVVGRRAGCLRMRQPIRLRSGHSAQSGGLSRAVRRRLYRTRQRAAGSRTGAPPGTSNASQIWRSPFDGEEAEIILMPNSTNASTEVMSSPRGGLRRQGGAPVAPGDYLDCVAAGSKTVWAGTGTLIAPDVVLTAGFMHAAADRVYFGHDVWRPGKIATVRKKIRHPKASNAANHDFDAAPSRSADRCHPRPSPRAAGRSRSCAWRKGCRLWRN